MQKIMFEHRRFGLEQAVIAILQQDCSCHVSLPHCQTPRLFHLLCSHRPIYSMTFCFLFGVAGLELSAREMIAYSLMLGLVVGSINNIERVMRELFRKED